MLAELLMAAGDGTATAYFSIQILERDLAQFLKTRMIWMDDRRAASFSNLFLVASDPHLTTDRDNFQRAADW